MSTAAPPDEASFCADLVRSRDFSRYAACLFMPAIERRAMLGLYAFNVEIVRVRDQVSQPLPGEIRLQWWTDMLSGQAHGSAEANPVAAELLRAIGDFDLPVEPLTLLADEHQFDLYNDPMPTMAALEGYLAATCSALFALAARIVGPASEAVEHLARHAGVAQGIVPATRPSPFPFAAAVALAMALTPVCAPRGASARVVRPARQSSNPDPGPSLAVRIGSGALRAARLAALPPAATRRSRGSAVPRP